MNSNYPLFWINEILTNGFVEFILYIFLIIVFLISAPPQVCGGRELYCIIANLIKFVIIYINKKTTKIIIIISPPPQGSLRLLFLILLKIKGGGENWLKKSNSLFAYFIRSLYLLFYLSIGSLGFVIHFRIIIWGFIYGFTVDIDTLLLFINCISEMIDNIIDSITLKMDGTDSDSNPLNHVYEFASKSSKPREVEKAIPELPKSVPKYPGKTVESVPNNLLEKRGLSPMTIEMPSNTSNPTPLKRINSLLEDVDKSIELYDNQAIKFRKHIADINNNTELWYDSKSKELFKEYLKVVDILKCQQKLLGNQAIDELKKLDPNTKHKYYK